MKIVEGFTFYNELDILQLKLAELYNVIDYFIIVEATTTHSGNDKELYFKNNKKKFTKYLDKIIHIVVNDMPYSKTKNNLLSNKDCWSNEIYQRNCIDKGIKKLNLNNNDLIIIGDCDEICDSDTLLEIKEKGLNTIHTLEMDLYMYKFSIKSKYKWVNFVKILPLHKYLNKYNRKCQNIREDKKCPVIKKGGWHLTYFGDIEFIQNKIQNYAHQEFNTNYNNNSQRIKKMIDNFEYFNGKKEKLFFIDIKDNKYLPKNYELLL